MTHVLVVRPDGMGDVLLAGPAVRAVAANAGRVTMLCGPSGAAAARRLPGVDEVVVHRLPWIDPEPRPVTRAWTSAIIDGLARCAIDEAVVFTSFHQSALPTAMVLRQAGVRRVAAISDDYPGALLDVRHRVDDDLHEVERNLSLAAAAGFEPRRADDDALRLTGVPAALPGRSMVIVHPGASVPARTLRPAQWQAVVVALVAAGRKVTVTGDPGERALVERVVASSPARPAVLDSFDDLATVIAGAGAIVTGNTGPAHVAAAVGTPVVSCFAPTVPAHRWRPWRVPHVLLGAQHVACAGCRARSCPHAVQHCLVGVTPERVVDAVRELAPDPMWVPA